MRISTAGNVRPPVHRVGRDAATAEAAGYAGQLFADHLMGWFPQSIWTPAHTPAAALRTSPHDYLDPTCAVMAAGATTSTLRLGFGVTDLLRTHPAVVARTALTLDHFTSGRFTLGLGSGEAENLLPYGISMERAVGRLEEGLEIIRHLWSSDGPVDLAGLSWPLERAVLDLEPFEGRTPPVWLAARGPRMRAITARLADGWLPMFLGPDDYASSLTDLLATRAALGRTDPFEAAFYAFVAVGDSFEDCLAMFEHPIFRCLGLLLPADSYERHGLEHPLGSGRYGLLDFVPARLGEDEALELLAGVPPEVVGEALLHGSPDDIAAQLECYADAGCEHAVLANVSFLTEPERARPSYEAMDALLASAAGFGSGAGAS